MVVKWFRFGDREMIGGGGDDSNGDRVYIWNEVCYQINSYLI